MKGFAHIKCLLFCLLWISGCVTANRELTHLEHLFNSPVPEHQPALFASDIFLAEHCVRDITFSRDYKEMYFTQVADEKYTIMRAVFDTAKWSQPAIAAFSGRHNDMEPVHSRDGKHLFFTSTRPSLGKSKMEYDMDIWTMEMQNDTWSEPALSGHPISTACMEYYPSLTADGTIYFGRNDSALTRGDIYYARPYEGAYSPPVKLPESVNFKESSFNAFIAPDESYILFSSYVESDSSLHSDLFISFRENDGKWSQACNLGEPINSDGNDFSPWISYEEQCLFFSSTRSDSAGVISKIYWISTSFLKTLAPQ